MAIIRTRVVNIHKDKCTVYIGRPSKFCNKYILGIHGSREAVIKRHKQDFIANKEIQEAVWQQLKSQTLGCFCKPEACHGDTYVEYIKLRMRNGGKPMGQWRKEDIDEFCKEI